jgi:RecA-family ATPase
MTAAPKFSPFSEPLSVPLALRSRKNWIGWRLTHNPDDPLNPKKMPVVLAPGVPVHDYLKPHAHVTYDQALKQVEPLRLSGIGFVMTLECGLIGGDMDKCRDPITGVIEPWAQTIIDRKETYFEISPSGQGVRFFSLTDMPLRKSITFKPAGVELYSMLRYLTFTGDRIVGTPLEIGRAPYAIETLMQRVADAKAAQPSSGAGGGASSSSSSSSATPDLDELFKRKVYQHTPMGKVNEAALKNLGAWVPELFPTAEFQPGTGAWRVKQADLGRPELEEDLSLSPDGIKDWGVHDMGDPREGKRTPIDVVMEWMTPKVDNAGAAAWLGARVGVPFAPGSGSEPGNETKPEPDPGLLVPLPFVAGKIHAPREWLVLGGWIPMKKVTLLQGDGGDGKSLLAHQLQASCATGLEWIGLKVEPCASVGIYTEDDDEDVDERQAAIDLAYGTSCCLGAHPMHRFPRAGEENELVTFDRNRRPGLTKFYQRLVEAVMDVKARLLVLDVAVDLYGGNEIVRPEVRALFRPLTKLARGMNGAVVMTMHVSQSGIKTDGGHSGSTDWSNAARSRLYLNRPKNDDGSLIDPDARTLTRKKANYAALGDTVNLRWVNGLLVPDGISSSSGAARAFRRSAEEVFLSILDAVTRENQTVSHKSKSGNYAPTMFAKRPPREKEGYGRGDFERALQALIRSRKIVIETYGKPSKEMEKLARNSI